MDPQTPGIAAQGPEPNPSPAASPGTPPPPPLRESLRTKAYGSLDRGKRDLGQVLGTISQSLAQSTPGDPATLRLTRTASTWADQAAAYLRRHSADELVESATRTLKDRLGVVAIAAFAAGFFSVRLLRT